jgi:hypothetical protein
MAMPDLKQLMAPKTNLTPFQMQKLLELFSKCYTEGFIAGATRASVAELGTGNLEQDIKDSWARSDIAGALSNFI